MDSNQNATFMKYNISLILRIQCLHHSMSVLFGDHHRLFGQPRAVHSTSLPTALICTGCRFVAVLPRCCAALLTRCMWSAVSAAIQWFMAEAQSHRAKLKTRKLTTKKTLDRQCNNWRGSREELAARGRECGQKRLLLDIISIISMTLFQLLISREQT